MIIYQSINPSHPNPGRREKFNVHFYFTLLCAASKSFMKIKIKIIKKESLAQVFSCEFCEISKDTFFFYRTPPVPALVLLTTPEERSLEMWSFNWTALPTHVLILDTTVSFACLYHYWNLKMDWRNTIKNICLSNWLWFFLPNWS